MQSKFLARFSAAVVVLAVVLGITVRILGDRLNRDQMLGCLLVGGFHFLVSLSFFLRCSLPYRSLSASDASIRRGFWVSSVCVVYALFQIPIWSLMTRCFPPDGFTEFQAVIATAGLVISMFGSGTPWIIIGWRVRAAIEGHKELSRQQKEAREKP